jgi:hypothetical protein
MQLKNRVAAGIYLRRFRSYYGAVQILKDDPTEFAEAGSLLSIHAAIALNDAVLSGYGVGRSVEPDHQQAVTQLQSLCAKEGLSTLGISRFRRLIQQKTIVSYAERSVRENQMRDIVLQIERFAAWVFKTFVELQGIE